MQPTKLLRKSQPKLKAQSPIKFLITLVLTVDLVPICFKI